MEQEILLNEVILYAQTRLFL